MKKFNIRVSAWILALSVLLSVTLAGCMDAGFIQQYTADGGNSASSETVVQFSTVAHTTKSAQTSVNPSSSSDSFRLEDVPDYSGTPYAVIHDNTPYFTADEITDQSYEDYSPLDSLGRCGVAMACLGEDLMPTEKREEIGKVKPSGWHSVQYDCVEGKSLYNRSHLIGFQLAGENANERNLITGTRYFNATAMLPFENMVADYIKETGNHVMYRVTPIFVGDELVARGALMEAQSVEDDGDGILFNVYCYNVQPGISIDYATGESEEGGENAVTTAVQTKTAGTKKTTAATTKELHTYVLNTKTKKFHLEDCENAQEIKTENRSVFQGTREELIDQGYSPCKSCNP